MAKKKLHFRIQTLVISGFLIWTTTVISIFLIFCSNSIQSDTVSELKHPIIRSNIKYQESSQNDSLYKDTYRTIGFKEAIGSVKKDTKNLWLYLQSQLKSSNQDNDNPLLHGTKERLLSLITTLENLDENTSKAQKLNISQSLTALVQKRIEETQNPSDCISAKKLVCNWYESCGYGCNLHHLVHCLIISYATNRMLVWKSSTRGGDKNPQRSLNDEFFQPLSKCNIVRHQRHLISDQKIIQIAEGTEQFDVVYERYVELSRFRPPYLPLSIPADIAPQLKQIHGFPAVWWIGQFVKFIFRLKPRISADIEEMKDKLEFQHPIVGIHVRRTDKLKREASFHEIEEYMEQVDEYYQLLERKQQKLNNTRRIYLATDDPTLLEETQIKYPDYKIISDPDISKSASPNKRGSSESLRGAIIDLYFLSHSDFLVCTLSSQFCRLAYELMQQYHVDASEKVRSLDDVYYFGGQLDHIQEVLERHIATNNEEINLEPGDQIHIAGNLWNGFSKGTNKRTGQHGVYPSYKVRDVVDVVDFQRKNKTRT